MPGQLTVRGGAYRGLVRVLSDGVTTIGREADNTLVLLEEGISRHHAAIRWDGQRYLLEDLGSKNGTWLNGTRLSSPEPLGHGDVITLPAVPPLQLVVGLQIAPVNVPTTLIGVTQPLVPSAQGGQYDDLRIEIDEQRREAQVRQIVESDFFQRLANRARAQRSRASRMPPRAAGDA